MSGVLKAVGTVFKKVLKVAKVVLPIALAVGAIVFTGGAALGLALPTWGAAVASVFGTSTLLGSIATGAVVWAGYGAVAGAVVAGVSGKSVMKGLQTGAAVGAVAGGVLGGIAPGSIDPIGNAIAGTSVTAPAGATAATAAAPITTTANAAAPTALSTPTVGASGVGGATSSVVAPAATHGLVPATSSFWSGADGPIAGGAIAGVGSGLGQAGAAMANADASQQEAARIAGNYALPAKDGGLLTKSSPTVVANPGAPMSTPNGPGRWKYDPVQQEFVFVPATPVTAGPTIN
jgi:hypothetical protein